MIRCRYFLWLTTCLITAGLICSHVQSAHADRVVYKTGNNLDGFVEMKDSRLTLRLGQVGEFEIEAGQVENIEYSYDLMEGDALSEYLTIKEELDSLVTFQEIHQALSASAAEAESVGEFEIPAGLQQAMDQFAIKHGNLLERLAQATRRKRCSRAEWLQQQAPADVMLQPDSLVFNLLPELLSLYRILSAAKQSPVSEDPLSIGLRLGNHFLKSIPGEVAFAQKEIMVFACTQAHGDTDVTTAWNRSQELLRFRNVYSPARPMSSLRLKYLMLERAFKERGLPFPDGAGTGSAQAWIQVLSAEAALAQQAGKSADGELNQEAMQSFSARLINLLDPDWKVQNHVDYQMLEKTTLETERCLNQLTAQMSRILLKEGYTLESEAFSPLKQVPGLPEDPVLFGQF